MPSRDESTSRDRSRPGALSGRDGAEHEILTSSGHCAICNLTFGSQERRVLWGGKAAHSGCAKRARGSEAA